MEFCLVLLSQVLGKCCIMKLCLNWCVYVTWLATCWWSLWNPSAKIVTESRHCGMTHNRCVLQLSCIFSWEEWCFKIWNCFWRKWIVKLLYSCAAKFWKKPSVRARWLLMLKAWFIFCCYLLDRSLAINYYTCCTFLQPNKEHCVQYMWYQIEPNTQLNLF